MSMNVLPSKQIQGDEEKKVAEMIIKQNIRAGDAILLTYNNKDSRQNTTMLVFTGITTAVGGRSGRSVAPDIQFIGRFDFAHISDIQKISPGDNLKIYATSLEIRNIEAFTGKFVSVANNGEELSFLTNGKFKFVNSLNIKKVERK